MDDEEMINKLIHIAAGLRIAEYALEHQECFPDGKLVEYLQYVLNDNLEHLYELMDDWNITEEEEEI